MRFGNYERKPLTDDIPYHLAGENGPRARPKDEEALQEEQIKKLKQKVGELVLDLDIMKEAVKGRPFAERTSGE